MNIDERKIDEVVLALLHLTCFADDYGHRAWKGHDWDVMNRLYEKGYIHNPKGKSKSISFTEEGFTKSQELFEKHFEGTP